MVNYGFDNSRLDGHGLFENLNCLVAEPNFATRHSPLATRHCFAKSSVSSTYRLFPGNPNGDNTYEKTGGGGRWLGGQLKIFRIF